MQSLQFWKSWAKAYQLVGLVIGAVFVFTLLFLWYSWFMSPAPALTWYSVQEQELTQIPVHTFQQGLLELTIQGDNYLIFDRLLGEHLQPNLTAGYIFLSILILSMVMLLSIITILPRFWYLLGMGLFILFVVGFRMEIISAFGQPNKLFTICVLVVYLLPTFYFQFFNGSVSFINRLLIFSAITIGVGVLIINFATVPYPLLHLSVTGFTAGIIISGIFILMVAHEILASFIFIVSQSEKQRKSLNHFLIISTVYMLNLAIAYAHKIGSIDWDFMYINFYLLISISGVLGIWGFRQRQPQYENIFQADPFGIYFFLSLGAICFASIGYFIGNANDSALVTINDIIIYAHLGFGIIFLTYVISNFFAMLGTNMPVHKVLYKPRNMPYFTFRFGGIIATLAFVFYNTWQTPVQHAFSGYHNAAGDLYQTLKDPRFAEAFYQQAGTYGYLNHHSNYAIANLEANRNYNTLKERNYYDRATQRRPTEFSIINLSQTYLRNKQWLEARLILNAGLKQFPDSGPIMNTLGVVYAKLNLLDSSLYFFQKAIDHPTTKMAAEANFVGIAAKDNLPVMADSLFGLVASENKGTKSNALAFANLQETKIETDFGIDLDADTVLNLFSANLLNNYLLNRIGELDSSILSQVVNLAYKPVNNDYREELLFASALSKYAIGHIQEAFSLMEEVTMYSNNQDKYNTILAMWCLENRAPEDALAFMNYVVDQKSGNALPVSAITSTEAGLVEEAIAKWDSLRKQEDSTYFEFAGEMINALSANQNQVSSLNDTEKYLYCNYRIQPTDESQFIAVLDLITDEELKARAILAKSKKLFELDETEEAIKIFQRIEGLRFTDKTLYDQIIYFELELLAKSRDFQSLANKIRQDEIVFPGHMKSDEVYYNTLISKSAGDSSAIRKQYRWLATANTYNEEAIIASSEFFKSEKDKFHSYSILADALHNNPFSVKILKAYSLEAARLGFSEYANDALERLRPLISAQALTKFLSENQNTFAQVLL